MVFRHTYRMQPPEKRHCITSFERGVRNSSRQKHKLINQRNYKNEKKIHNAKEKWKKG